MGHTVRVAVIGGQPLYRDGIAQALRSVQYIVPVEGVTTADAITIAKARLADIVLIDADHLIGGSLEFARTFANDYPELRIVLLADSERAKDMTAAVAAGMRGYVLKHVLGSELVRILEAVHHGETYVPSQLRARFIVQMRRGLSSKPATREELTKREEQIVTHVSRGLTNKEVGKALRISEKTVKHYMTAIMRKLQVRNRVEASIKTRGETKS